MKDKKEILHEIIKKYNPDFVEEEGDEYQEEYKIIFEAMEAYYIKKSMEGVKEMKKEEI